MKEKIQENRWNPSYYFKNSSLQLQHAKTIIDKYHFSGKERILDIGCGDGKITATLSQLVPHGEILGIDKSEKMIAFAKNKFSKSEFSNVSFDWLNASEMNYENLFDLIVSFSCLHYIKNDEQLKLLKNVRHALKPSGKLLLMLYRKCPAQWAAIDSIANSGRWKNHFRNFTPDFYEYLPANPPKLRKSCACR